MARCAALYFGRQTSRYRATDWRSPSAGIFSLSAWGIKRRENIAVLGAYLLPDDRTRFEDRAIDADAFHGWAVRGAYLDRAACTAADRASHKFLE